jgi:transglutaminase-like putative cysteine protease
MARTNRATARAQRLNAVIATCLLAGAAAFALGRVFSGAGAPWRLFFAALASALLACALERRNLLLATLVSAAGLLVAIGVLLFPETTLHGLPTIQTLHAIARASQLVGQQAREQVAPTVPLRPLMLAALTAVWAAIFSGHALAFRAGSPLLALLPPVALVAFADTVLGPAVRPFYGVGFLVAALALLFADGLRRVQAWGPVWTGPGRNAGLSATAGRGARRVAAAAVAAAMIAPILLPGFGTKAVFSLNSSVGRIEIDPMVSVAARLKSRTVPQPVFEVTTEHPTYYRMLSLTDFDGTTWKSEEDPQTQPISGGSVPLMDIGTGARFASTFTVQTDLGDRWLPVPYPTTQVDDLTGASMGADIPDSAITLDHDLGAGTTYTTTSLAVQPTPAELRNLGSFAELPDALTELPTDLPPQIGDLAHSWTDSKQTTYDKVLAIMNTLRSAPYTYDTSVTPKDNSAALRDFLTIGKRGFCEQFSASMAVMLRTLGIPARVVVGFTSGHLEDATRNLWKITTQDAHSWVEVKFPTYGWLRFDPTPAGQIADSVSSTYAVTTSSATECPLGRDSTGACIPKTPTGGTGNKKGPNQFKSALLNDKNGTAGSIDSPIGPHALRTSGSRRPAAGHGWLSPRKVVLAGLLLFLLALGLVPPVRRIRRRIRLRRAAGDHRRLILTSYDVFTQRAAELGCPRGPGETVEEYRSRLASSELPVNGHLDRLTTLTAVAAYAAGDPSGEDASAATDAADSAWRDMRRATPLIRRVTGAYHRD